jgi:hypothetical protein
MHGEELREHRRIFVDDQYDTDELGVIKGRRAPIRKQRASPIRGLEWKNYEGNSSIVSFAVWVWVGR